jgi:hypothetical protein
MLSKAAQTFVPLLSPIGAVVGSVWVKGFEATDTAFRNSCRYLTQIAARYPCFKVSRRCSSWLMNSMRQASWPDRQRALRQRGGRRQNSQNGSDTQASESGRRGRSSPANPHNGSPADLHLSFSSALGSGPLVRIQPELVWGFRCQGDFFAGRPSSIPPIAAGRHDCGESIEVEIDNDLEGFAGGIVA